MLENVPKVATWGWVTFYALPHPWCLATSTDYWFSVPLMRLGGPLSAVYPQRNAQGGGEAEGQRSLEICAQVMFLIYRLYNLGQANEQL